MVAERVHAPGLITRAAHAGAERRGDEHRHRGHRDQEDDERRPVEARRRGERQPERARAALDRDAIVAVGDADPAVGDAPDDLAERHRDHDEGQARTPQRQHREHGGGQERQRERAGRDREVAVAAGHDLGARVGRDTEQPGVAQADQARVARQHVHAEREDGVEEDLARDVDVVGAAHPQRQRDEGHEGRAEGKRFHAAGRPNNPWGRTTSTISMGRNSTT